jgi:hypothetical protein
MPPVSNDEPPGEPMRDEDPPRPPPRPVAPPGQVSTPDQLPTVEPGEWPAQPRRAPTPPPEPAPASASAPPPVPVPQPLPPGPPASPYPVPAKRSLTWLWIALAAVVVLVVGTTATLAVVQPWEDDGSDRDVAGAPADADQSELSDNPPADPTPTTPPSAPSTPPLPSTPPGPIAADLDSNGYGDAIAVFESGDGIERVVLSSTGRSFDVAREPVAAFEDRTWADFDGDGEQDQVSWTYELDGTLNLTSEDMDFRELNLRLRLDERQPFVSLKPGDFDGDGAVDLVAYGASGPRQVGVWILRNDGGRFTQPDQWMEIPDATYSSTTLLPADFTDDAMTDVAVRVPRTRDELGLSLLTSTGTAFAPGPIERPTDLLDDAEVVVGDFTGDGTPRVLLLSDNRTGLDVQGVRRAGDRFLVDTRLTLPMRGGRHADVVDAVVSDADGDGVDDVVYTTVAGDGREYDGFRVLRLDEPGVESSEEWAPTPRCPAGGCSFYFQNSY